MLGSPTDCMGTQILAAFSNSDRGNVGRENLPFEVRVYTGCLLEVVTSKDRNKWFLPFPRGQAHDLGLEYEEKESRVADIVGTFPIERPSSRPRTNHGGELENWGPASSSWMRNNFWDSSFEFRDVEVDALCGDIEGLPSRENTLVSMANVKTRKNL
ncbi:hypothetical protein ACSQ67_003665 [Phaseolus vulgaris]